MIRLFRVMPLLFVLAGCASRPPPPPIAVVPAPQAPPPPHREEIPIAIQKLVAAQRTEIRDMNALAQVVGDRTGRVRAQRDVDSLATEFTAIESTITTSESERLDAAVAKLLALDSKIELLHDKLRAAHPDPGPAKAPD
jgi:hypothetical protein